MTVSYTVPPPPAQPRQRPAVVSAAVWLLYAVAALWLLGGAVAVAVSGSMREVFERAFADDPTLGAGGAAGTAALFGTAIAVVTALVFAAGLIVLAVMDGRGSNVARIITWVAGGLAVCCAGYNLIGAVASDAMMSGLGTGGGGGVDAQELQTLMDELIPSWYGPVTIASSALQVLLLLVAVVLLALPASNAFFRRQQPQNWEPPVPGYPPPAA